MVLAGLLDQYKIELY